MGLIDFLITAFGHGVERQRRLADKRQEGYQLIAEANGEAHLALDIVNRASDRILRRIDEDAPKVDEGAREALSNVFARIREENDAAIAMLQKIRL